MSAAKIVKPADTKESRQPVPREFYDSLDKNKAAFVTAKIERIIRAIKK